MGILEEDIHRVPQGSLLLTSNGVNTAQCAVCNGVSNAFRDFISEVVIDAHLFFLLTRQVWSTERNFAVSAID
jgi:hypothetical protein